MHDRNDGGHDRGGPRHDRDRPDAEAGGDRPGGDRPGGEGAGQDTRFLDLEISQVLYGEAENVTRQAVRELLVEAAKERVRQRFGEQITALAELAVDELMTDVQSSLDIEARIQARNEERGRIQDQVREILSGSRKGARAERSSRPPKKGGRGKNR